MGIYEKLISYEKSNNLFELEVNNYPIWGSIRHIVYRLLTTEYTSIKNEHRIIKGLKLLKSFPYVFRNNILKHNKKADLMFVCNPRRNIVSNKYFDIYSDPIIDFLKKDYSCFCIEDLYSWKHLKPPHTENLYYFDFYNWVSYLKIARIKLKKDEIDKIKNLQNEFDNIFDMKIDLYRIINKFLTIRKKRLNLYENLIKRVEPKLIFIICSYGKEIFIEAAKNFSIPVIELQHGFIHPNHVSYNTRKRYFPDFLFTFGSYWKKEVNFPILSEKVIPVGFPYMESNINKSEKEKNTIVILSQWTIGKLLVSKAIELMNSLDDTWTIYYKLHPVECSEWMNLYPELNNTKIKVISNEMSLYELFNICEFQCGVYSFAIFEGLRFGCKTLLFDFPESENLKYLIDNKIAFFYKDVLDFTNKFEYSAVKIDSFFKLNSLLEIELAINKILENLN